MGQNAQSHGIVQGRVYLGKDEVYGKWDFKNRLDCETV